MVDPKENKNQELIEALKTDYDEEETSSTKGTIAGFKLKKLVFLIILITILLIVTLWLLSLDSSKKTKEDYTKYESEMISAAKQYYKVNKNELPENNKSSEVTLSQLVKLNYMENYSKISSCEGSVVVQNDNNNYSYSPYLDCGNTYTSKVLFRKLTDSSNIVTSDSGLYRVNNEYIYRGERINNYVKFGGRIWRIVKIDSNNDIVLVLDNTYDTMNVWDDRYNNDSLYNSGYNDFEKSRIKDFLSNIYTASKNQSVSEEELLFKAKDANKLLNFKLCIGKSNIDQTVNNNTYECQKNIETKIGILTLSDYVTASIDKNCTSPSSKSCENYNYLASSNGRWWLATANTNNTYEVFIVSSSGEIFSEEACSYENVRPVIHLGKNTTYSSGKGTFDKPYVIK